MQHRAVDQHRLLGLAQRRALRHDAGEEAGAARPGLAARLEAAVELADAKRREGAREARRRPRREGELGGVGEVPRLGAARVLEGEGQPVLGLDHLGRAVQPQLLGIAAKVGDRHEQVERLIVGQQRVAAGPLAHCGEGVEQQVGERRAAERRRQPGRAHEIGELGLDLGPVPGLDGLVDAGARRQRPGQRHRRRLGQPRDRAAARFEQGVDIGRIEPEVGERVERLAGGDGMAEEDRVDPARAGPGEDVDQHPDVDVALRGDGGEERAVAVPERLVRGARMHRLAGLGEPPDLLGDAVHVDGEADAAVADQGDAELLLLHAPKRGRKPPREQRGRFLSRALRAKPPAPGAASPARAWELV